MDSLEALKKKLSGYSAEQIIFTSHARIRAAQRGINLDEIKSNIVKPDMLFYAVSQAARRSSEKKYDCYFSYSKSLCHRYVLIINRRIIVCTVIKINKRWQRKAEKYERV